MMRQWRSAEVWVWVEEIFTDKPVVLVAFGEHCLTRTCMDASTITQIREVIVGMVVSIEPFVAIQ
jgi:hypothetical protein